MRASRIAAGAEATLAVVIWGASFIATRLALRELSPAVVVWMRFAMGVVVLGAAVAVRREFAWPGWKEAAYFTLLGFIGITFHQWLQSTGLQTSQASTTGWIVTTSPVFIAVLGWVFLKERLGPLQVLGIALAAAGVLLVATRGDWRAVGIGRFGAPGDVLILISAINWAVFSVLSRAGLRRHPATQMIFYVVAAGWLLSTPLLWTGPGLREVGALSPTGWLAVGFLGFFCSGLAYIFWYDALKVMAASQLGVFLYLEPLVTLAVAAVVLGEAVVGAALAGGAIILLGVWLVTRR